MPTRTSSPGRATSRKCVTRFRRTFRSRIGPGLRWRLTTWAMVTSRMRGVLAQMRGKNPDSWADVREQLPLLAQETLVRARPSAASRADAEPVQFVEPHPALSSNCWNGSRPRLWPDQRRRIRHPRAWSGDRRLAAQRRSRKTRCSSAAAILAQDSAEHIDAVIERGKREYIDRCCRRRRRADPRHQTPPVRRAHARSPPRTSRKAPASHRAWCP